MLDHPMCCPNSVHDTETSPIAAMNIMPLANSVKRWLCMDCQRTFTRENGISILDPERLSS